MSRTREFRVAFWTVMAIGTPGVVMISSADAAAKIRSCQVQVSHVGAYQGTVSAIGGASCPGSTLITWRMSIYRGGERWASSVGIRPNQPQVSRACRKDRRPTSFRAVLEMYVWSSPTKKVRVASRGRVSLLRCR